MVGNYRSGPNLYIAKCITHIMGGNISMQNTFENGGMYIATIKMDAAESDSAAYYQ